CSTFTICPVRSEIENVSSSLLIAHGASKFAARDSYCSSACKPLLPMETGCFSFVAHPVKHSREIPNPKNDCFTEKPTIVIHTVSIFPHLKIYKKRVFRCVQTVFYSLKKISHCHHFHGLFNWEIPNFQTFR